MENEKGWVDKKIWKKVYCYCRKCGEPKYNKIMGMCEECGYKHFHREIGRRYVGENQMKFRSFEVRINEGFNLSNSMENGYEYET